MGDDGDDVLTPLISSSPPSPSSPLQRQRYSAAGFGVCIGVADTVVAEQLGCVHIEALSQCVGLNLEARGGNQLRRAALPCRVFICHQRRHALQR